MEYPKLVLEAKEVKIDSKRLVNVSRVGSMYLGTCHYPVEMRKSGKFAGHAIYLPDQFDYILGKDEEGRMILVPLEKE